jgi:beta-lactamase regulating signal transducer with metallopeptidase domain
MELYLIKSAACLGAFLIFYKLFLENENMHTFKRFYLIGMVLLSFIIPLITFTTYSKTSEAISPILITHAMGTESNSITFLELLPTILWMIYFIGVAFFTFRFSKNLSTILLKIKRNPKFKTPSYINVLLREHVIPHTFFNYIFLNKSSYDSKDIPVEVLLHEQTHACQKHSLDVLFIEVLQIIFWFNPLIYVTKSSIKLNHEFLADEAVLSKGIEPSYYQKLLLVFSSNTPSPHLANSINYSLIKKRFTVMKTQTSKSKVWIRSFLLLPLLAILIFSFSSTKEIEKESKELIENTIQEGASKAQINEYNKLAKKYNDLDPSNMRIKKSDVDRLTYLYNIMSDKQRKNAVPFPNFPPVPPAPDKAPEPMRVVKGVNDTGANVPPPPPKAPKSIKVIKGVNDTEANIPPPPPKATKVVKGVNDTEANIPPPPPKAPKASTPVKDPIKTIEKLAKEGAQFYLYEEGPHFKDGRKITKEKAIEVLKKVKGVIVNIRDDKYLYTIVELKVPGC